MLRCYLDTMTLIHFKRFNTLDWRSILETSDQVELTIAPIILRELNKKKDSDQNKGIRERAGDILKEFEKYQENGIIGASVTLNFICIEPQIDWKQKGLDSDVSDDRLIASMILEEDISKLVLVTSDFGLRQKARNRNIRIVKLDDSLKEDVRLDADAKRIKELERKLTHYENASPKLELYIKDSPDSKYHEFKYQKVQEVDPIAVEVEIKKLKKEVEYKETKIHNSTLDIALLGGLNSIAESEIDRYKNEVNDYLESTRKYHKNKNQYENYQSRLFTLELVLSNTGGKAASDIDIFLHFPDGFEMIERKRALSYREPSLPSRPTPPRTTSQMLYMNTRGLYQYRYTDLMPKDLNRKPLELGVDYSLDSIKKTNSYDVRYHVKKLKQNLEWELESICLLFSSYDEIKPFSFDYVINVENHQDEFKGTYHINFKCNE